MVVGDDVDASFVREAAVSLYMPKVAHVCTTLDGTVGAVVDMVRLTNNNNNNALDADRDLNFRIDLHRLFRHVSCGSKQPLVAQASTVASTTHRTQRQQLISWSFRTLTAYLSP